MTVTPDSHPHIKEWVQAYVPPQAHKVMLLIANISLSPWWNYLVDDVELDFSETLRGYAYAQNVMLPNEPLWHTGGKFTMATPEGATTTPPPILVQPLMNVVAPIIMANTHKLMCREFVLTSEENQRILEASVADPLIHALHSILGGAGMTEAIDALLKTVSVLDSA